MAHEQHLTSFGLFLQTARLEKKMPIEALAAETRIRVEVLKWIETEDHANLPNEVFVKGFIRSYALAVDADADEALERYGANRSLRQVTSDHKATAPTTQPNRFWLGLATAVGAVLLVAGLTLYLYVRFHAAPHNAGDTATAPAAETLHEAPGTVSAVEEGVPPSTTPAPPSPPQPKIEPSPSPMKYLLEIKAIEETWLKIITDDQGPQELTLQSNEVKQIEAASHFNLLIGNAAGVELKLNGKPVEVAGKSGQVVNILLP